MRLFFIFQYHCNQEKIQLEFNRNQVLFILKEDLTLQNGEIMSLQLEWVSNIQVIPEIDSPLQNSVLCAPEVQFSQDQLIGIFQI